MGIVWLLIVLALIIVAYKVMSKRMERQRLERRRVKVSRELEREEELAPLHAEIKEKEMRLNKLKLERFGVKGKGKKKPIGERLESFRVSFNKFRKFIGVDTSKSRW